MLLFCRHAREGNTTMNVTKHYHRNRRLCLYFHFANITKEPFEPHCGGSDNHENFSCLRVP